MSCQNLTWLTASSGTLSPPSHSSKTQIRFLPHSKERRKSTLIFKFKNYKEWKKSWLFSKGSVLSKNYRKKELSKKWKSSHSTKSSMSSLHLSTLWSQCRRFSREKSPKNLLIMIPLTWSKSAGILLSKCTWQ